MRFFQAGVEKAIQSVQKAPPKPVHIFVAIPTIHLVDIRWAFNTHVMLDRTPVPTTYAAEWRWGVAEAREKMVEAAMAIPTVTHIMFLDSDVVPPVDAISQLLADDRPIVSGLYFNSLNTGVAAWVQGKTIGLNQPADVVQVDAVGLGCCLIRREVFEAIKKRPMFYMTVLGGEKAVQGEDFYFFSRTAEVGYKPFVDMRIKSLHIKNLQLDHGGNVKA